jgi:tRNA(adenine34) deaminase
MNNDIYYMEQAYKEATKAFKINEIQVGAVIVNNKSGKIISRGYNRKEKDHLSISHAEINAIIKACKKNKDWRLVDHSIYVTLKPCDMCMEVIKSSQIDNIYYCCEQNDYIKKNIKITKIKCDELEEECSSIIKKKFTEIRKEKK